MDAKIRERVLEFQAKVGCRSYVTQSTFLKAMMDDTYATVISVAATIPFITSGGSISMFTAEELYDVANYMILRAGAPFVYTGEENEAQIYILVNVSKGEDFNKLRYLLQITNVNVELIIRVITDNSYPEKEIAYVLAEAKNRTSKRGEENGQS